MRWLHIREAKIDADLKKTFEQYGTVGMQVALGDMNHFKHQGQTMKADMGGGAVFHDNRVEVTAVPSPTPTR